MSSVPTVRIDTRQLQKDPKTQRSKMVVVRLYLKSLDVPHFDLEYSTLSGPNVEMVSRLAWIYEMCQFIKSDPIAVEEKRHDLEFLGFLLPAVKLNSAKRYRNIVNIDEIENRFSNADNGCLWGNECHTNGRLDIGEKMPEFNELSVSSVLRISDRRVAGS